MSTSVIEMSANQKPVEVMRTTAAAAGKKSPIVTEMEGDHERPAVEMDATGQKKAKNETHTETYDLP